MALELLANAGAALASSPDVATTMDQVAGLTVPELADLCVIDLLADDGSISGAAVAAADPGVAQTLTQLRERYPLDPAGEHPVVGVLRAGEPALLAEMTPTLLNTFAESDEHARFMTEHGYRSAIVVPLVARGRTLGAISTLRVNPCEPYERADLRIVEELARRAALALDNARLHSELRETQARLEASLAETKRAQLEQSFLAEASRVLASSLDYEETLKQVARLAVPRIADWCAVEALDERGELRVVAVHHVDPAKVPLVERLRTEYSSRQDYPLGARAVLVARRALVLPDIAPDALAGYASDRAHIELRLQLDTRSKIIVPMIAGARVLGAITLATAESGRRLSADDLPLAEELGRRAGTAVENARVHTGRDQIAGVLEQSLLPETLPDVPGIELAVRYRAAGELNEVGGDFYDVVEREDGCWLVFVGDVCGKGAGAASVTGLARHTLRAAALTDMSPTQMLTTLHKALVRHGPGTDLCTVCLVSLPEPGRATVCVALAGHPRPLLVSRRGRVRRTGRTGTLLGVFSPLEIREHRVWMRRGETLLVYTDGATDAGAPQAPLGEDGLVELLRSSAPLALPELLDRIERAVLERAGGRLEDDVALLAIRREGARAPPPRFVQGTDG